MQQERFRMRYFSDDPVRRTHERALDILDSSGILIGQPGALEMFKDANAATGIRCVIETVQR